MLIVIIIVYLSDVDFAHCSRIFSSDLSIAITTTTINGAKFASAYFPSCNMKG